MEKEQPIFSNLPQALNVGLDFVPVVGDVKSGIEAIDALRRGQYKDAALSALGILPFIPSITKYSNKIPISQDRLKQEVSYYGYPDKSSKGILTYMPPQKFLDLVSDGGQDVIRRANEMKKFDANKLMDEYLPFIDIDKKNKFDTVVSHEGRARATRALMDNVPSIPVVISTKGERFKSVDDLPSVIVSQKNKVDFLENVEPIKLLNRE